ncbi:hypothetical protein SDC9_193154 [bioreactor metagenome]|uniref:Gfo/Idh/MocA-like oxidoreductase C-terminal domain-containing protein n=1 Tax=bioreactor metagenome TaxID=1076179 RepID=A0A645I2Q6_9ZZZZ
MLTDLDAEIRLYTQDCCVQNHSLTTNHSRWDQYAASFRKSLTAYLDSLRNGTPPPVSGMDGLAELQFEAALRRSAALKRPVDIQNEFPLDVC